VIELTIAMTSMLRPGVTRQQAVANLRHGGFQEPVHIFAEPGPLQSIEGVVWHPNARRMGGWGNWRQAANWLLRYTTTRYLMLVEDDVDYCAGARQALEEQIHRVDRFSLITLYYPVRDWEVETDRREGWFLHNRGFYHYGNLALVFDREGGIVDYLQEMAKVNDAVIARNYDQPLFKWLQDHPGRCQGVWTHNPSLVDHIGHTSTLRHGDGPHRQGHAFDRDWLPIEQPGGCLAAQGIPVVGPGE
jgi:hypothetical protein